MYAPDGHWACLLLEKRVWGSDGLPKRQYSMHTRFPQLLQVPQVKLYGSILLDIDEHGVRPDKRVVVNCGETASSSNSSILGHMAKYLEIQPAIG